VIATLSNPELSASVGEARAAVGQSRAARDHVYAGVRQEEVDVAARAVDKATADLTLAEEQFRRTSAVTGAGYSSKQNLDNAQAAVAAARANLVQMQSEFAAAQHGPTAEDRASADAAVAAAEASLAVVERREEKLQLRAPVDGVVETVVGELGEATVPGRTVLTITATAETWFSFNVREDALRGMDIGSSLTLTTSGALRSRPGSRSCAASAISPPGARRAPSAITISTPSPFVPIPVVRSTDSSPA
jgi:multidrug resistance efflux pump